ncbi:ESX secretion-associated protein EspG [Nocardia sp. NPDC019395]|uniref:ESX secretion-associated protein EspG n=1 Tax=Nocardia sp. NPDC019395 TaxID=3154686 RepID=UPI0033C11A71
MSRTWCLTDVEFVALWEELREGLVPRPFEFTSRTSRNDEYLQEKAEARQRARDRHGRSIDEVLELVARPDIRIVAHGWDRRNPDDPTTRVRLLAARRGDRGYLLTQLPGETIWHSGGYTIVEVSARGLADAVVKALPECATGRLGELVFASRDGSRLDYSYQQSIVGDPVDDPDRERARRFSAATVAGVGRIRLSQGYSRFGPRGIASHELHWRDLVDDGRYAITTENPPVAVGVGTTALTALLNDRIAAIVRSIKDERE